MIPFRTAVVLLSFTVVGAASAAAHKSSMEDQMACTPDVYRLCAAQIPDEDAIVSCLKGHRNALSADCAKVFSRPDTGQNGATRDEDD